MTNAGRPLRVLQLTASLAIGGAERMILGLAQGIDRDRFDLRVCALYPSSADDFSGAADDLDVPVHELTPHRFYDPRTVSAVARLIREHEIDVVHTHVLDADVAGQLAGRITRTPVVTTLHSVPDSYERQPRGRYWPQRLTVRRLARHLVCVSETARDRFVEDWSVPVERLRTIHPAVPLDPFLAVTSGPPPPGSAAGPVVTAVGRLVPAKAQHLLVEAAPTVLAAHPNARFVIVGPGPREDELRQLATSLGVADRVDLPGARHDIAAVLAETDVFTLTSEWEGLPISAIEAMAAARPVVLTDVGGCRDLVDDGRAGVVVPPGDSDAIADALIDLLGDDERRRSLGDAARRRVVAEFSLDRMTRAYESLYDEVGRQLS